MRSIGLGFFLFARRYSGNNYCSFFLLVLECFTSQGLLRRISLSLMRNSQLITTNYQQDFGLFVGSWLLEVASNSLRCNGCPVLRDRVSPFGHLRIKGCLAPHRSLSQLCYVLHRLFKSRHPPYALKFPIRKFTSNLTIRYFVFARALCLALGETFVAR